MYIFAQVILVPFSHNDPGWLKTFTTYFDEDTRFILDTVITKMEEYKDMTFVWAELSFLQLWWDQAASSKRRSLRELIRSGRFEIVTGGWVMADEASSRVYGLINQLVEGHQWLRENLNFTPSTGFSIDPFGHGSTLPYLLAATGFDGMIIQRVHFAWKHFLATKQYGTYAVFLWPYGRHSFLMVFLFFKMTSTGHRIGMTAAIPVRAPCWRITCRSIFTR